MYTPYLGVDDPSGSLHALSNETIPLNPLPLHNPAKLVLLQLQSSTFVYLLNITLTERAMSDVMLIRSFIEFVDWVDSRWSGEKVDD